mgnify:CR=1 FL=1
MKLKFIKKWINLFAHKSNYFQQPNRHASAHIFLDGTGYAYKSVPLSRVAWSVGGFYKQTDGAGSFYKKATNANTLNIELCNSVDKVPDKVYKEAVELTRYYMKKYNISASHVIRHWDVNGKDCPDPWIGKNNKMWKQFKKDIAA